MDCGTDSHHTKERAERLKALRKRLRVRMAVMGSKLGVKAATISSYERELRTIPEPVWKLIRIIEVIGF
jgi:transcriptional regulator with XRE-family HTH domain